MKRGQIIKHSAYDHEWNLTPILNTYSNGRTCLSLIHVSTGEPFAKVTINVPSLKLKEGEIVIRNTQENEGLLDSLVKAGIVSPSKKEINLNYIIVHVVDLLIK